MPLYTIVQRKPKPDSRGEWYFSVMSRRWGCEDLITLNWAFVQLHRLVTRLKNFRVLVCVALCEQGSLVLLWSVCGGMWSVCGGQYVEVSMWSCWPTCWRKIKLDVIKIPRVWFYLFSRLLGFWVCFIMTGDFVGVSRRGKVSHAQMVVEVFHNHFLNYKTAGPCCLFRFEPLRFCNFTAG